MVQHNIMFGFIKKMVIGLLTFSISLTSINNVSDRTKCICLNNQPCMTRTTLINLNTIKDCITIHLWLMQIYITKVVILCMIYPTEFVLRTKQKM